jgi:hypothetical protein
MLLDTMTYDNLFAGELDVVTDHVTIAAGQTIARGDLLVKTVAEAIGVSGAVGTITRTVAQSYVKATAEADEHSFYAIAAEAVTTTGATAVIEAYMTGMFNQNAIGFGGATAGGSKDILAANGIFITAAQKQ